MDARAYITLGGIQDQQRRDRDQAAHERLATRATAGPAQRRALIMRPSRTFRGVVGAAFVRLGEALGARPVVTRGGHARTRLVADLQRDLAA